MVERSETAHPVEVSPERHDMAGGGSYSRKELNGHWVEYSYFNRKGDLSRQVAFPRNAIISDEVIDALYDEELAAEAAAKS